MCWSSASKQNISKEWFWPSYCGLEERWVGSRGQLQYWGFNTLNTHCLAIAICSSASTEHAVGVWKGSLSKLIQKNVFLLNPCSKGEYVTHSYYIHRRNWSVLLKRRTDSLTFYCISFQPLKVGNAHKFNIDPTGKPWGCGCTYQPDLWWCSLKRSEVCMGSCWKHRWLPESRSCTVCGLVGYGQPRGAGWGPGGVVRCQRCRHTASTFPAQAGTSYRWRCRRCLHGHPGPEGRSIPARVRSRSQWILHYVVQKE